MTRRKIRLGGFLNTDGGHIAAWRHPSAAAQGAANFNALIQMARIAEQAKIDFLFMGDVGADVALPEDVLGRSAWLDKMEPLTVLTALAAVTERIGLIGTATTSFAEPYTLARRLASMDHLSKGRTGWNIVTTMNPSDAMNFGRPELESAAERYRRAAEFVDVARGLWDSWDDDAFIRDKATGRYIRPGQLRHLNHHGAYFDVRGPLDQPRPPQGHPVLVQAGASNEGRTLAARIADVVFVSQQRMEDAQAFYADIKARAVGFGRHPDDICVLVGLLPVVAPTLAGAEAKFDELQALLHPSVALQMLSTLMGGLDLSIYPLDEEIPPLPPALGLSSRRDILLGLAKERGFTLRQLALHIAGSRGHSVMKGTPTMIADHMQRWFEQRAADGFLIVSALVPASLQDFADMVLPELRHRGLFREAYEGQTLRENLGLKRPPRMSPDQHKTKDVP